MTPPTTRSSSARSSEVRPLPRTHRVDPVLHPGRLLRDGDGWRRTNGASPVRGCNPRRTDARRCRGWSDRPLGPRRWASGPVLRTPGRVASLAFSSDGRSLASGGFPPDSPIILWDLDTGRRRLRLEGKGGPVMALAPSGDGGLLASAGGHNRGIRLWDLESGKLRRSLEGQSGAGRGPSPSAPDGTIVGPSRLLRGTERRAVPPFEGDHPPLEGDHPLKVIPFEAG